MNSRATTSIVTTNSSPEIQAKGRVARKHSSNAIAISAIQTAFVGLPIVE